VPAKHWAGPDGKDASVGIGPLVLRFHEIDHIKATVRNGRLERILDLRREISAVKPPSRPDNDRLPSSEAAVPRAVMATTAGL
jgi:hypothetical protein